MEKILKRVLKGSHIRVETVDYLLLHNAKQILESRYPEAKVESSVENSDSVYQGQFFVKKNVFDRLVVSVYKDSYNHVSYITTRTDFLTFGCFTYTLGLVPLLLIWLIQWIVGKGFKQNVSQTLIRDLKVKYHVNVESIDGPINNVSYYIIGLISTMLIINSFIYFIFRWEVRDADNYDNGFILWYLSIISVTIFWTLYFIIVRLKQNRIKLFGYVIYIITAYTGIWLINESYHVHWSIIESSGPVWFSPREEINISNILIEGKPITSWNEYNGKIQFEDGFAHVWTVDENYRSKGQHYVIDTNGKIYASDSEPLYPKKLTNDRLLIRGENLCAVVDMNGEKIIDYDEYNDLSLLNATTLIADKNDDIVFLDFDGNQVNTMATFEYSTNIAIWVIQIIAYVLFILCLFFIRKKCIK